MIFRGSILFPIQGFLLGVVGGLFGDSLGRFSLGLAL